MKTVLLFFVPAFFLFGCSGLPALKEVKIAGQTMGTVYQITYLEKSGENYQSSLDSLFRELNESLSTYISTSQISRFNSMHSVEDTFWLDPFFSEVFQEADKIFHQSGGMFDPTVMPLVNLWGFGPDKSAVPDSSVIDSIRGFIGLEKIQVVTSAEGKQGLLKLHPFVQLDFSAIAKGFGADLAGRLLLAKGVNNYMVEIGGEVAARGKNSRGQCWRIGIEKPDWGQKKGAAVQKVVSLKDQGMATSGNYRNFKENEGKRYGHTINPLSGFPEINDLLSVSVVAPTCMKADAWATALMAMGYQNARQLVGQSADIHALFIFSADGESVEIFATEGFPE